MSVIRRWLCLAWLLAAVPAFGQVSRVDGTALSSGGTPNVSSCGGSPSLASGSTDDAGQINVGTGVVLTCQLNWSATMAAAPFCIVGTNLSTLTVGWTTDTAKLSVTVSATLGGGKIYYLCRGGV